MAGKEILTNVGDYIRGNWGAPFIVGFMPLLIVAAASLSVGLVSLADQLAVYGYYALVAGVIGQLICYLKYGRKNGADHDFN